MANYEVNADPASGIVACRIFGFLSDGESTLFAQQLLDALTVQRRRGPGIKVLFDNREGSVFSSGALQALSGKMKSQKQAGDRTAVLVANQINLLQARRNMSDGDEVFVSEEEARAWLVG